jgi:hypothetical protein
MDQRGGFLCHSPIPEERTSMAGYGKADAWAHPDPRKEPLAFPVKTAPGSDEGSWNQPWPPNGGTLNAKNDEK